MRVVIQGAGRGIGYAMAKIALSSGVKELILTARKPKETEGFYNLLPSENLHWVAMDFLDPDSIAAAGSVIVERMPTIDRVVIVAGVLKDDITKPEKSLRDLKSDALHHSYQINAIGPILFIKSIWPSLRKPHPIVIGSISARVASITDNKLGGWYGYRASKAALNQLSHTTAIELARYNPQSCMVTLHPGTVDTDLSRPFQNSLSSTNLFKAEDSALRLWQVMNNLIPEQTGSFFAYDGSPIPF